MTAKNTRALIFGIVVSLVAFYFALRNVNFSVLLDSVLAADWAWVAVVLVSYMVHYWLKAMRWRDLLEPVTRVTTAQAYPVMMTGFFANNILPAHLGEFVRMYVGAKTFQAGKTQVLSTIALERALDFSTVALMFGVALVAGGSISGQLVYAGYVLLGATVLVWLGLFISLRYEQAMLRFFSWLMRPLPARIGERAIQMLAMVLGAMHSMKSVRLVVRSVVLSLAQWALVGLAIYAAMQSVGISIGFAATWVALTATVLAVALPAAPGFFGTIQLAFVLALAPYGITESDALAGSVIFHLISYGYAMVAGVIALNRLGMKLGDLNRGVEQG